MVTISAAKTTQSAYLVRGTKVGADGKSSGFKCFPASCNDASMARNFDTEAEAAAFLKANPSWGIRMNPGSAIVFDLLIDGVPR